MIFLKSQRIRQKFQKIFEKFDENIKNNIVFFKRNKWLFGTIKNGKTSDKMIITSCKVYFILGDILIEIIINLYLNNNIYNR